MIEIKISIETAVVLLTERMDYEFERRVKTGKISAGTSLKNLAFKDLINLVEVSVFDLICLLPVELLLDQTNLTEIVTKAIHSLSDMYHKEEFKLYKMQKAKLLIKPVVELLQQSQKSKSFLNN